MRQETVRDPLPRLWAAPRLLTAPRADREMIHPIIDAENAMVETARSIRTAQWSLVGLAVAALLLSVLLAWRTSHPALQIAMNVSALGVQDANLANRVAQMAKLHRAAPRAAG